MSLKKLLSDRMGMKAKSFLAQKWEEEWQKPVAKWREELGIEVFEKYIS